MEQVGLLGDFPEQGAALLTEKTKHHIRMRTKACKSLEIMYSGNEVHLFCSNTLLSFLGSRPFAAPRHLGFIAGLAGRAHFYRSVLKWSRRNCHFVSTLQIIFIHLNGITLSKF